MSESEALRALMQADRWIERVSAQRSHLPEIDELRRVEDELRSLLAALREAEGELAPVQLEYEAAASEAQRMRTREGELDKALASSTANTRELTAIHGELDQVRALLAQSEDRELELLLALEPLHDAISALKQRAQPGVERRSSLQATIAELQQSLDDELRSLREQRSLKARELSKSMLSRYESALARAGTSGAAEVDQGRCDGCRIALSPLDVDRWKSLPEGEFMACPECGRLLLS